MFISAHHTLLVIIIVQCITYQVFFLGWKGVDQKSNGYQLVFLLLLSLQMLGLLMAQNGFYSDVLIRINVIYGFAYGPLIYLYTGALLYENRQFKKRNLLHAIPMIISTIVIMSPLPINFILVYLLYLFISIFYFIVSKKLIRNFTQITLHTRSILEINKLLYLQWLFGIYVLAVFADSIQFFSENTEYLTFVSTLFRVAVFVIIFVLVNVMFYFSIFHANFLYAVSQDEISLASSDSSATKLITNAHLISLDEKVKVQKDLEVLQLFIQKTKPYLSTTLTLNDLSKAINIQPRYLSQIINHHFGTNFSNYINSLRIRDAAERLKTTKDEKETVAEVMYATGFNSKSAFFTAFKREYGVTPKKYKELYLKTRKESNDVS